MQGSTVRVYLAGGVAVEAGDHLVTESHLPGRQGRLLFAVLAVEHRRAVPREELAETLSDGDPPPSWDTALRAVVSKLRTALRESLGPKTIESAFGCYQLQLPAGAWIDLEAATDAIHLAESLVRDGRTSEAGGWAGPAWAISGRPFLPGEDGPWIDRQRELLRDVRIRSLCCLAEISTTDGEPRLAVRDAAEAVQLDPFGERAYRLLMRAHAAAGDRAAAIKTYERCRELLAEELGLDPSSETEAVYLEILRHG